MGNDESEDTGESNLSSEIEEDYLDHQQEVVHLGKVCQDKLLRSTSVPLPNKQSRDDTFIAHPLFPNSWNAPATMAPPLLKRQNSTLLNKLLESDHAPSARALVLANKSSGDQNALQPKASSDQNVPQNQKATLEVAKRFMQAIVFTKNPWPIISDDKYSMVEEASKLVIEAHDGQQALAGAPVGTPSVWQFPGGLSLNIDPQTREGVSLEIWLMHLYQIDGSWLPSKYI